MRFTPHEKRRPHHKYQHIYAYFLYCLMTLMWFVTKDFNPAARYKRMGLIGTQKLSYTNLMARIIGFLIMQFIAGFILGIIFQPAHVVPTSDYPMPDESGNIDADWAVSQLYNTANFAPGAKLFSWYVGDLNYIVNIV